jgi:putative heme-binding domain-containing protein
MRITFEYHCVTNVKRSLLACLVACLVCCAPYVAKADDESESLALLVDVLAANDVPAVHAALLQGMLSGLEGRRNVTAPKGWSQLSAKLAKSEDKTVRDLTLQLSQIFGDPEAAKRAIALLKDTSADPAARRTALRSLLSQQNKEVAMLLESLLDDAALQVDAIRGHAMAGSKTAPALLLGRYEKMNPAHRRAVIETLASRKGYAETLLAAVKGKAISQDEIPVHVARSLRDILGDRFTEVFGEVKPVAEDREKLIAKYKKLITPKSLASADALRGRAVFKKTCASCHLLYGEGGKIGPDLTGSNRANLDYILLNSVDPSYDVPEGYRMVQVITVDGLVINGLVAEEDGARLILKTVEQPRLVIAKEDIDFRRVSPKSMMPDGQLDAMKPQEVIDLIKYLRTTEQVETRE